MSANPSPSGGREPPSASRIAEAREAIDPVFLGSPLVRRSTLDAVLGCRLHVKVETLNPIRSFKGRGASWYVARRDGDGPLVTASAGNFGQGVAWAARSRGLRLTVFSATTANPLKLDAMRRLGAEVRLSGGDFDSAKAAAVEFALAGGGTLVVDGDEPAVAEGAGTIAAELTEADVRPDVILVPLGNGALATGVGAWLKAACPTTRVVAVVAKAAPCMKTSFDTGSVVETGTASTIADGIAVRVPVPYALDTMRGTVDEVVAVTDEDILAAMRLCHERLGLVVEPAGAAGLAAVVARPQVFSGQDVATILCGGNLTPAQIRTWLTPETL
jgi:threonine dehydratase